MRARGVAVHSWYKLMNEKTPNNNLRGECEEVGRERSVGSHGSLHADADLRFLAAARPQVRLVEEACEKHKVGEVHSDGELNVELRDTAGVSCPLRQIVVCPYINSTSYHHLSELQCCDAHGQLLGWEVSHTAKGIVRVHDTVDTVVHDDEPTRGRRVLCVGKPTVKQHSDVVVPVQEDERLLA